MKKLLNLKEKEIEDVASIVKNKIFVPRFQRKTTIFLCGADITDKEKSRSKLANIFNFRSSFELLYPEDLFEDLLAGQGQYSLLELENTLADSVDAIVLFPESPGSFAELGAFSNNQKLAQKMIVLISNKYKSDKSFINYGPNRLVRNTKTGKVLYYGADELEPSLKSVSFYRKISGYVATIKKEHPVKKDVTNILEVGNFILPCIYLIDEIDNVNLYKLVGYAASYNKKLCEIATKSSLGKLIKERFITRTPIGYKVTQLGASYVRSEFSNSSLDKARIELMNAQNRRNARVSYDRVVAGAHL
ncbi:retron St85 family effector protein [Vreelandella sp. TE19]